MSATETFSLFGALPAELRLQIWREALSARCVWAAVFDTERDVGAAGEAKRTRLQFSKRTRLQVSAMAHVGAAPYMAGLACRESRDLLEKLYIKPWRMRELATGGAYWVDLERTVVWLGHVESFAMLDALRALSNDVQSRIKCVAVLSTDVDAPTMHDFVPLRFFCRALHTIIIQRREDAAARFSPLSPELAAYYATLPDHASAETPPAPSNEGHDSTGPYFLPYPTLHLVSSDFADRLEKRTSF